MNYSNLPVYIKKEESSDPLSFADIYDPTGDSNSLYMVNKSTAQNTSVQYFKSPFSRVSGNASNYEELIAPKINYTSPDVEIILPQFRSLVFYNLDGSRTKDPNFPNDDLPPLYLSGYNSGSNTIDYITAFVPSSPYNGIDYYLSLKWSGSNDRYSLDLWSDIYSPGIGIPLQNIFSASGTGFSSGWKDSTDTYTGVVCSGFGISASGILNAINNPTGYSPYFSGAQQVSGRNSISGSAIVSGILSAGAVDQISGYVYPHTKLTLGKAYYYVPAQNISIDYQAQNDGLRVLGVDIDQSNQFTNGATLQAKISFNSYVNPETSGALTTILDSSGNNFYSIGFGKNIYSGCYLNNYDVNVEPFKPVGLNASYVVNNAPVLNSNKNQYITVNIPASANYLLDSESLTGSNYIYTNLGTPIGNQSDPNGGYKATLISGQGETVDYVSYSINNSGTYTWQSITGTAGSAQLAYLQSDNDLSTGVAITGGRIFQMGDEFYSKVFISNNGIISFDSADQGYADYQNQDFPIPTATKKFIAAYWKDMFSSGGTIWYRQDTTRFIIEYNQVNAARGFKPQTYQIVLYFHDITKPDSSSRIEMRYKDVSRSAEFSPNPNIGIQWSSDQYINYGLNKLDATKSLRFSRISTAVPVNGNFIYKNKITPDAQRTFSIHLKRFVGNGNIRYTLNSGIDWTIISPPLSEDWSRYSFPSTIASQQIGIEVQTSGDAIYVYGEQLEPLGYVSNYIPTSGFVVIRDAYSFDAPVNLLSPTVDLTTGFANTMINGNTCSISSTTGFVSNIQSSIRYSVNCGRSPVYNLGQTNASNFILDTVEKQMDISSTDLASFINFSGSRLPSDLNLTLKNAQDTIGSIISMKSGANIFSQQMNIQEGETLTTQVSIKEIIV